MGPDGCHMVYRAQSRLQKTRDIPLEISTIGYALSSDRVTFRNRRQLIAPQHPWERFGCEDPRVTKIGNSYYIFYTAIATWPPSPAGIKVAGAVTNDFSGITRRGRITPFNAKAMTAFPQKIRGKLAVLLTANSDLPPSTIGIAFLESEEQLWDESFWKHWYATLPSHALRLLRTDHDHIEIGAPPLYTPKGWLLVYSYIKSYQTSHKFFTIEAALLDMDNPQKILARTEDPLLYPEESYELQGKIPNVIFPSGAVIHNDTLGVYYGAADTSVCLATCSLKELFTHLCAV